MADLIIGTIEKSFRAQVRVTLGSWRGQHKVHVREYYPGPTGEWWPGKGACVAVDKLPELLKALQDGQAIALERGLLTSEKDVAA